MITPEIAVAYTQCKLKAYLLLCSDKKGISHEYISILEEESKKNREKYLSGLKMKHPEAKPYSPEGMKIGKPVLFDANLTFSGLEAYADVLTIAVGISSQRKHNYAPTIVVGTHKINKEQKFQLAYVSYVLSNLQKKKPVSGAIVGCGSKAYTIKLEPLYQEVDTVLKNMKMWTQNSMSELPPIILNKHCPYCLFQKGCKTKAVEKDDLSLLSKISPKNIQKYQKKGIFTVNQLSYLFSPRKQRKGKKKTKLPLRYRPELQALAIRTEKIYIQELPKLSEHKVELFLDIEGTPDQDFYYLIGLLISDGAKQLLYSFWADSMKDEQTVWDGFIEKVNKYPDAPIYHYGAYDSKAIHQLKKRYGKDSDKVEERLVNVNSFIYGKVYFPVKSNGLKELGGFLGAIWTHPESSGLQSLVWRYRWNESQNNEYRQILLTYNEEDCKALCLLTKELLIISETADSKWNVDFADQPKKHATHIGIQIHEELEQILQSAHADYDKNKISLKSEKTNTNEIENQESPKILTYTRLTQTPGKVIYVPSRRKCPRCKGKIKTTEKTGETIITDLVFTKNGCRKTITKYIGKKVYCGKCQEFYNPKMIRNFKKQKFGHPFMAWSVYQRIILRLPYYTITQVMEDMFTVRTALSTVVHFIRLFAKYYSHTEKSLTKQILNSPFIHADETRINIQGESHYVWVFTDGKHVVLRKTETREASIVHEFLSDYTGVLVSDFYPGYDSVKCRQQKCWTHLIQDINEDLWKASFNEEFEFFVLEVRNLIVPIFQTIQKYGSKKRHLNKFKKTIDQFYKKNIDNQIYKRGVVN